MENHKIMQKKIPFFVIICISHPFLRSPRSISHILYCVAVTICITWNLSSVGLNSVLKLIPKVWGFICRSVLRIGTHNNSNLTFKRFSQNQLKFYMQIFLRLDNLKRRKNGLSLWKLSGVFQNFKMQQFKNGVFDMEVAGNDSGLEWISGIML